MNTRPAAKAQPDERVRAQKCLERRQSGESWQAIADAEGYADRSGPQRAVERLLDRIETSAVGSYREVEAARLDVLQSKYWATALAGDHKSAELVLKVSAQRCKLLGLNVPDRVVFSEAPTDEAFAALLAEVLPALAEARTPAPAIEDSEPWSNIGTDATTE